MSLFLAVDAGGTKADYVLADETRILARARSATIKRMRTDAQSATHALNGAFTQLQAAAGVSLQSVTHTCIGTAGVGIPLVVEFLRAAFHARVSGPLLLLSDVEIALDAAFPNAPGVLVLAGTGSNVAARTAAGKISTFGGWGPFLADQGSGHSIGHGALRAAFLAIDRHQHTSLMPRILAALNLPTIDALGAFANSHPTPDVSRLALVVLAAAQAGDSVAAQILHTQGEELGELACLALRRIAPAGGPAHLACAGSILQHVLPVRDAMTAYIHRQFPAVAIHPGVVDPIDGALWRARQLPESGEHEAP